LINKLTVFPHKADGFYRLFTEPPWDKSGAKVQNFPDMTKYIIYFFKLKCFLESLPKL